LGIAKVEACGRKSGSLMALQVNPNPGVDFLGAKRLPGYRGYKTSHAPVIVFMMLRGQGNTSLASWKKKGTHYAVT
jgi:hypothetical protein